MAPGFDTATIFFVILFFLCAILCCIVFVGLTRTWFKPLFTKSSKQFGLTDMVDDNRRSVIQLMPTDNHQTSDLLLTHAKGILFRNKLKLRPEIDQDFQGLSREEVEIIFPELLADFDDRPYFVVDVGTNATTNPENDNNLKDYVMSWLHRNQYTFTEVTRNVLKIYLTRHL